MKEKPAVVTESNTKESNRFFNRRGEHKPKSTTEDAPEEKVYSITISTGSKELFDELQTFICTEGNGGSDFISELENKHKTDVRIFGDIY